MYCATKISFRGIFCYNYFAGFGVSYLDVSVLASLVGSIRVVGWILDEFTCLELNGCFHFFVVAFFCGVGLFVFWLFWGFCLFFSFYFHLYNDCIFLAN